MKKPAQYRFSQMNNELLCCLASPGILSDTKFVFPIDYEIKIPNTLTVDNKGNTFRKICDNYKDFNNNTFIKFRKIELDIQDDNIETDGVEIDENISGEFDILNISRTYVDSTSYDEELKERLLNSIKSLYLKVNED